MYSGKASFYNNPDYGNEGDKGDDLGVIRLYDDGLVPDLTAKIYHGPTIDPPPLYVGNNGVPVLNKKAAVAFVVGFGDGTDEGDGEGCDDSDVQPGMKRIGRLLLTGATDDNGAFGFGNPIAVEGKTQANAICPGDSGAAWAFAAGDDPSNDWHVFGVHSGNGLRSAPWLGNDEWATVLRPKMKWITNLSASKGVALGCPAVGDTDKPGTYRRCTEGYWMVSLGARETPYRFQKSTSTSLSNAHFGDFDGDGRAADAFVSAPNGDGYVLYKDAAEWRIVAPAASTLRPAVGDFDGDRITDCTKKQRPSVAGPVRTARANNWMGYWPQRGYV